MSSNNEDCDSPIWKKIDQHTRDIRDISMKQSALEARQQATEERLERMLSMSAEHRVESRTATDQIMDKIGGVEKTLNEARGGIKMGLWIFGGIATILGLVIAAWKVVFGQ